MEHIALNEISPTNPYPQNSRNHCRSRGRRNVRVIGEADWWWCTPLIPALLEAEQADLCEFEANLIYRIPGSQGYTEKSCLKTKQPNKR